MPFWIPMGSFIGGVLYASWDLETRLLSLAKYVEREFENAKVHIDSSLFMPDYVARQGFIAVQAGMGIMTSQGAPPTTGTYIRAIAQKAKELDSAGKLHSAENDVAAQIQQSLFASFRSDYWVVAFLFCPHLNDERAVKFRRLLIVYKIYAFLMVGFLLYLFVCSGVSHLQRQERIQESTFTRMFHVERFLIMPMAKPPEAETALYSTLRSF